MELILERIEKRKTYTVGRLYLAPLPTREGQVEGLEGMEGLESLLCSTLEPTWRDYARGQRRIPGRSAIPEGRYAVVISYSQERGQWLPVLLGGPDFNRQWPAIRIRDGESFFDTEGDILVGETREEGWLAESRSCLRRLKRLITDAKERGEAVHLTVKAPSGSQITKSLNH